MAAAAGVAWEWQPTRRSVLCRDGGGGGDGMVRSLAVLADGVVFVGHDSGRLRAFRADGTLARTLLGHDGACLCLLIYGGALWSGGADRRIKAWSLASARGVAGGFGTWIRTIAKAHHAAVKALYPGGVGRLWSLSEDRTLRCWRTSDGAQQLLIRSVEHTMLCAAVGGGAHSFAACAESAVISVYRASDGARMGQLAGHNGVVWAVLARGERVFTGGDDATVRAWQRSPAGVWRCACVCRGHKRRVTALALSPDAATLYSAAGDGALRAWKADSGECTLIMLSASCCGAVRSLALSPDGALLFAGGSDGCVRQYSAADGALLAEHTGHADDVHLLALSPTGQLWSGGYDGDVRGVLVSPPWRWRRDNHFLWPEAFRCAVRAFLLCVSRRDCAAHALLSLGGATSEGLIDAVLRTLADTIQRKAGLPLLLHAGE